MITFTIIWKVDCRGIRDDSSLIRFGAVEMVGRGQVQELFGRIR